MVEHLLPISKTNVVTLINRETDWGVAPAAASTYKRLAFNANSLARQQTLTPNPELRGSRTQGALVVGPKNPGGPFQGYQTDETLPMFYEALFGKRVTVEVGGGGMVLTAAVGAASGVTFPDTGSHAYCATVTKTTPAGTTLYSTLALASAVITADGAHKTNVTRTGGTMPVGWTWTLYRTKVGGSQSVRTNYFAITPAAALVNTVTTYADDQADSSLGVGTPAAASSGGAGDFMHTITIGDTLPSYTVERSLPYLLDASQFIQALGAKCDTGKVQFKSTGYFDLQSNWLMRKAITSAVSAESGTAIDWRFGEKLHHAMVGSGLVKVGLASAGIGAIVPFGKFMDVSIDHNNNLDKTDFPLGGQGDRGSLTELQAISTITGTLKISDPSTLDFLQSAPELQIVQIEHDLATVGHKVIHTFYGCQLDPMDPVVSGQGILTAAFTAHGVEDPLSGLQAEIVIINGVAGMLYDANV